MKDYINDLIDIHINGQLELYASDIIEKDGYNVLLSDLIDDAYWNFAYLKNSNIELNEVWQNVKCDMKKHDRQPVIYLTSKENLEGKIQDLKLNTLYTDVWMTIEDLNSFEQYESKIDFEVVRADEKLKDKFVQAIMDGFSSDNPDEPYESLSDGYRVALEKSMRPNNSEYKVINYLGLYNEETLSTATVLYKKDKAIIYNVTTNKKYQKQGVCKKTMSKIIKDLMSIGIKVVGLQTEKGFYTEQVYKSMGFKEIMLGKAYVE